MTITMLAILADDAGHRALPVRLPGPERQLWRLLSRPDDRDEDQWDAHAEEMTGRLLQGPGVTLNGVTVTDLGPFVRRGGFTTAWRCRSGSRPIAARSGQ